MSNIFLAFLGPRHLGVTQKIHKIELSDGHERSRLYGCNLADLLEKPGLSCDVGARCDKFHDPGSLWISWGLPSCNDHRAETQKSKQGQFQIVDVVQLFAPICKMTKQIVNANTIPLWLEKPFVSPRKKSPVLYCLNCPKILQKRRRN